MHYNESSAPTYSRNPLSIQNSNVMATAKKQTTSLHAFLQTTNKNNQEPSISYDSMDQIFQTSVSSKIQHKSKEKKQIFSNKEQKIQRLRQQINKKQNQNSHLLSQEKSKTSHSPIHHPVQRSRSNKKIQSKKKSQQYLLDTSLQQTMFSPKILSRSKSLARKVDIGSLLYEDAIRRQNKMQFKVESERRQQQILTSPKINTNTNILVLKKIKQQFNDLVTENEINPILLLSILQQLFNVDLNPHKPNNSEKIEHLLQILSQNDHSEISKEKVWGFISLVILGQKSQENQIFSWEDQNYIIQKYRFLYKQRMTRERKSPTPRKPTFRPQTLDSSNKLANSFREKTCRQIDQFVQNQKINLNIKDRNYTIEDLFIIDHHKKLAEKERKKLQQQNKELQQCTFRPDLSNSSSTYNHYKQKPKIPLRSSKAQHLRDNHNWSKHQTQISIASSAVVSKNINKASYIKKERVSTITDEVKNAQKVILRLSVGRQKRQFSNQLRQRGYPKDQNWNSMQRSMHQESIENIKKLKGLKSK